MLWKALDEAGSAADLSQPEGEASRPALSFTSDYNALRLIILTGGATFRSGEYVLEQINGNRWTIPETKTVKVISHRYILWRFIEDSAHYFRRRLVELLSKPSFPVTGDAITRALNAWKNKIYGRSRSFSPHDLRAALLQAALNIWTHPERLIELLLNHVPKDRLIRTYCVGSKRKNYGICF